MLCSLYSLIKDNDHCIDFEEYLKFIIQIFFSNFKNKSYGLYEVAFSFSNYGNFSLRLKHFPTVQIKRKN